MAKELDRTAIRWVRNFILAEDGQRYDQSDILWGDAPTCKSPACILGTAKHYYEKVRGIEVGKTSDAGTYLGLSYLETQVVFCADALRWPSPFRERFIESDKIRIKRERRKAQARIAADFLNAILKHGTKVITTS